MGVLGQLYRGGRYGAAPDDNDPGLWTTNWNAPEAWAQGFFDTGIPMTPELAMTVSAVWAGVTFMSRNMASLDLVTYERDGRKRFRRDDLPIASVVGRQPNNDHTAVEYWEMAFGHVLLRGNAYSLIVEGSRSFADQLIPIHPDRVKPERLPSGRIRYKVQNPIGPDTIVVQDEMFHLRGFMSNGLTGVSLTAVAARSLGAAVAADTYAARFFKQGASASLVATVQDELDDESELDLHTSISRYLGGLQNVGGVLILDGGTTVDKIGINPTEAQLLSTREHAVREVARWLGLPAQVLADAGKEPTHASAEIFSLDLIKYAFAPFGRRIEQAVDKALLIPDNLFVEYDFARILRGDLKARSQFYQLAVFTGWLNRAEVRERENLNPGPPELEEFLQPSNMMMAGEEPQANSTGGFGGARRPDPAQLRAAHGVRETLFALELANRVVGRELAAVEKAAKHHANDGAAWAEWLQTFYDDHASMVSTTLKVPMSVAREYAARQGLALQESDRGVEPLVEDWKTTLAPELAALALGDGGQGNA